MFKVKSFGSKTLWFSDRLIISGSGTQFVAAEQLGRKCYGMEISPQYCDVIVKRWETLTGKKAKNDRQHPTA